MEYNKSGYLFVIFFLVQMTEPIKGTNINCNGKAFHCMNSTHFKICVDLGGGISKTVDDFLISCPPLTYCKETNYYECEYESTTISTADRPEVMDEVTQATEIESVLNVKPISVPHKERMIELLYSVLSTTIKYEDTKETPSENTTATFPMDNNPSDSNKPYNKDNNSLDLNNDKSLTLSNAMLYTAITTPIATTDETFYDIEITSTNNDNAAKQFVTENFNELVLNTTIQAIVNKNSNTANLNITKKLSISTTSNLNKDDIKVVALVNNETSGQNEILKKDYSNISDNIENNNTNISIDPKISELNKNLSINIENINLSLINNNNTLNISSTESASSLITENYENILNSGTDFRLKSDSNLKDGTFFSDNFLQNGSTMKNSYTTSSLDANLLNFTNNNKTFVSSKKNIYIVDEIDITTEFSTEKVVFSHLNNSVLLITSNTTKTENVPILNITRSPINERKKNASNNNNITESSLHNLEDLETNTGRNYQNTVPLTFSYVTSPLVKLFIHNNNYTPYISESETVTQKYLDRSADYDSAMTFINQQITTNLNQNKSDHNLTTNNVSQKETTHKMSQYQLKSEKTNDSNNTYYQNSLNIDNISYSNQATGVNGNILIKDFVEKSNFSQLPAIRKNQDNIAYSNEELTITFQNKNTETTKTGFQTSGFLNYINSNKVLNLGDSFKPELNKSATFESRTKTTVNNETDSFLTSRFLNVKTEETKQDIETHDNNKIVSSGSTIQNKLLQVDFTPEMSTTNTALHYFSELEVNTEKYFDALSHKASEIPEFITTVRSTFKTSKSKLNSDASVHNLSELKDVRKTEHLVNPGFFITTTDTNTEQYSLETTDNTIEYRLTNRFQEIKLNTEPMSSNDISTHEYIYQTTIVPIISLISQNPKNFSFSSTESSVNETKIKKSDVNNMALNRTNLSIGKKHIYTNAANTSRQLSLDNTDIQKTNITAQLENIEVEPSKSYKIHITDISHNSSKLTLNTHNNADIALSTDNHVLETATKVYKAFKNQLLNKVLEPSLDTVNQNNNDKNKTSKNIEDGFVGLNNDTPIAKINKTTEPSQLFYSLIKSNYKLSSTNNDKLDTNNTNIFVSKEINTSHVLATSNSYDLNNNTNQIKNFTNILETLDVVKVPDINAEIYSKNKMNLNGSSSISKNSNGFKVISNNSNLILEKIVSSTNSFLNDFGLKTTNTLFSTENDVINNSFKINSNASVSSSKSSEINVYKNGSNEKFYNNNEAINSTTEGIRTSINYQIPYTKLIATESVQTQTVSSFLSIVDEYLKPTQGENFQGTTDSILDRSYALKNLNTYSANSTNKDKESLLRNKQTNVLNTLEITNMSTQEPNFVLIGHELVFENISNNPNNSKKLSTLQVQNLNKSHQNINNFSLPTVNSVSDIYLSNNKSNDRINLTKCLTPLTRNQNKTGEKFKPSNLRNGTYYESINKTDKHLNDTQDLKNVTKYVPTRKTSMQPISKVTESSENSTVGVRCLTHLRGKYSDKNDCRKFYVCVGETEPLIGQCPVGTVFSEINKQCTKNLSHCIRNNRFQCLSSGRYYDVLLLNTYYICVPSKNGYVKFKFQCVKGYTLNKTTVRCIEDHKHINVPISTIESSSTIEGSKSNENIQNKKDDDKIFKCENTGKFADPVDCKKYYICSKNNKSEFRRKSKKCESDKVWHKEKRKCVDDESYECKLF